MEYLYRSVKRLIKTGFEIREDRCGGKLRQIASKHGVDFLFRFQKPGVDYHAGTQLVWRVITESDPLLPKDKLPDEWRAHKERLGRARKDLKELLDGEGGWCKKINDELGFLKMHTERDDLGKSLI